MDNPPAGKKQKTEQTSDDNVSKTKLPDFLQKTYEIFSNPEYENVCSFGETGETIVIKKVPEFCSILPLHFKHENFQSFVRQLNMYDFHKTAQDPTSHEFQHTYFRKGRPDLIHLIKRKANDGRNRQPTTKSALKAGDHQPMNPQLIDQSDMILRELVELRQWRMGVQTKLDSLVTENRKMVIENDLLWQSLQQHAVTQRNMQTKMQKILYFMYDMYLSSGGQHKQLEREGVFGAIQGALQGPDDQLQGKGFTNLSDKDFFEKLKVLGIESPIPQQLNKASPAPFIKQQEGGAPMKLPQPDKVQQQLTEIPQHQPQPQLQQQQQSQLQSQGSQKVPSTAGIAAVMEDIFSASSAPVGGSLFPGPGPSTPPFTSSGLTEESMRALEDSEKQTRQRIANIEDSLTKLFKADDFSQLLLQNPSFPPLMEDQLFEQMTNVSQTRRAHEMEGRLPVAPPISDANLEYLNMLNAASAPPAYSFHAGSKRPMSSQHQPQQAQHKSVQNEVDLMKMFGEPDMKPPG